VGHRILGSLVWARPQVRQAACGGGTADSWSGICQPIEGVNVECGGCWPRAT